MNCMSILSSVTDAWCQANCADPTNKDVCNKDFCKCVQGDAPVPVAAQPGSSNDTAASTWDPGPTSWVSNDSCYSIERTVDDYWCSTNCAVQICPSDKCSCDGKKAATTMGNVAPDTVAPQPSPSPNAKAVVVAGAAEGGSFVSLKRSEEAKTINCVSVLDRVSDAWCQANCGNPENTDVCNKDYCKCGAKVVPAAPTEELPAKKKKDGGDDSGVVNGANSGGPAWEGNFVSNQSCYSIAQTVDDFWCATNCPNQICPKDSCACDGKKPAASSAATPVASPAPVAPNTLGQSVVTGGTTISLARKADINCVSVAEGVADVWCMQNCQDPTNKDVCNKDFCKCGKDVAASSQSQQDAPSIWDSKPECRSIDKGVDDFWCATNCVADACPTDKCDCSGKAAAVQATPSPAASPAL